jgi:NAD(P)-dependent dehydrogenase (short-subunit alcohol dehydrogenase family)
VAIGLGEAGATVYVTGRTMEPEDAVVPVPTSLRSTVEEVEAAGGVCVPVQLDQREDRQVEELFRQVEDEQGRLDVLVNSAWAGYENIHRMQGPEDYIFELPFWELPQSVCDDMLAIGLRSSYVASRLAAPLMVPSGSGLIAHISSFAGDMYLYNVAYGVTKQAVDRMASDMAHELREDGVACVSLYPGLVRTEAIMRNAEFFDLSNSESPTFTGRAVAALVADPDVMEVSGQVLVVAELAEKYGFEDVDGKRPTSMRGRSWDGVA